MNEHLVSFDVYLAGGHRLNVTGTRMQLENLIETLRDQPPDNDRVFFWPNGFFRLRDVIAIARETEE